MTLFYCTVSDKQTNQYTLLVTDPTIYVLHVLALLQAIKKINKL